MFHLQTPFENSLRTSTPSPKLQRKAIATQHKHCTGYAHASGNYFRKGERTPSSSPKPPRHNGGGIFFDGHPPKPGRPDEELDLPRLRHHLPFFDGLPRRSPSSSSHIPNSASASSEGCSETDSLDSSVGDVGMRQMNNCKTVCDRLHSTATKASIAKTARMRFQDEEDEDGTWIQDLRKRSDGERIMRCHKKDQVKIRFGKEEKGRELLELASCGCNFRLIFIRSRKNMEILLLMRYQNWT